MSALTMPGRSAPGSASLTSCRTIRPAGVMVAQISLRSQHQALRKGRKFTGSRYSWALEWADSTGLRYGLWIIRMRARSNKRAIKPSPRVACPLCGAERGHRRGRARACGLCALVGLDDPAGDPRAQGADLGLSLAPQAQRDSVLRGMRSVGARPRHRGDGVDGGDRLLAGLPILLGPHLNRSFSWPCAWVGRWCSCCSACCISARPR